MINKLAQPPLFYSSEFDPPQEPHIRVLCYAKLNKQLYISLKSQVFSYLKNDCRNNEFISFCTSCHDFLFLSSIILRCLRIRHEINSLFYKRICRYKKTMVAVKKSEECHLLDITIFCSSTWQCYILNSCLHLLSMTATNI